MPDYLEQRNRIDRRSYGRKCDSILERNMLEINLILCPIDFSEFWRARIAMQIVHQKSEAPSLFRRVLRSSVRLAYGPKTRTLAVAGHCGLSEGSESCSDSSSLRVIRCDKEVWPSLGRFEYVRAPPSLRGQLPSFYAAAR